MHGGSDIQTLFPVGGIDSCLKLNQVRIYGRFIIQETDHGEKHMQKSAVISKVMVLKGCPVACFPLLLHRGSVI